MNRGEYLAAVREAAIGSSPSYSVSYQGKNYIPYAYRLSFSNQEVVHEAILIGKDKMQICVPLTDVETEKEEVTQIKSEEEDRKKKEERILFPLSSIPKNAFQYKEFWFIPALVFPEDEETRREKNLAPLNYYLSVDLELGYFPVDFSSVHTRYATYNQREFLSCIKKTVKENIFYCPERDKYYCPTESGLYLYHGPTEFRSGRDNHSGWMSIA